MVRTAPNTSRNNIVTRENIQRQYNSVLCRNALIFLITPQIFCKIHLIWQNLCQWGSEEIHWFPEWSQVGWPETVVATKFSEWVKVLTLGWVGMW